MDTKGLSKRSDGTQFGCARCYINPNVGFRSYSSESCYQSHFRIVKEVESQLKEQFDRRTIRLEVSGRVLVGKFFTVLQGRRIFGKGKIESIRQFIKDAVRAETEPQPVAEAQFRQLAGNQSEGDASQQGPVLPRSLVECSTTPPPSHLQGVDEFQKAMDILKLSGASPCPNSLAICEKEYKAKVRELEVLRKKIEAYAEGGKSGDENRGKRWSDMDEVPPLLDLPNSGEQVQAGQRKHLAIFSQDDFEDVGIQSVAEAQSSQPVSTHSEGDALQQGLGLMEIPVALMEEAQFVDEGLESGDERLGKRCVDMDVVLSLQVLPDSLNGISSEWCSQKSLPYLSGMPLELLSCEALSSLDDLEDEIIFDPS